MKLLQPIQTIYEYLHLPSNTKTAHQEDKHGLPQHDTDITTAIHEVISHLHHVQERLNYPNLFLPEPVTLPCKDYSGHEIQIRTRVYRSQIPYILFWGESSSTQKLYLHPIHFPLLFAGNPGEASLSNDPQNQEIITRLLKIRALFEGNKWFKQGKINGCACDLFSVKEYVEYSITEEKKLIEQFKDKYELAALEYLLQKGEYPR